MAGEHFAGGAGVLRLIAGPEPGATQIRQHYKCRNADDKRRMSDLRPKHGAAPQGERIDGKLPAAENTERGTVLPRPTPLACWPLARRFISRLPQLPELC